MSNTAVDGILAAVTYHENGEAEAEAKIAVAYAQYRTATANGNHCARLRREWLELKRVANFHAKSIVSLRELAHERLFAEAATQLADPDVRSVVLRPGDLVTVRVSRPKERSLLERSAAWIAGYFDTSKWFPRVF